METTGYSLPARRPRRRTRSRGRGRDGLRTMLATWHPTRPARTTAAAATRGTPDRGWTWPPPLGRDFQGPLGATRRGRADSPTPCSLRRGRTTSTAAERYAGPPPGQGRSCRCTRALHRDPGCGPATPGCTGGRDRRESGHRSGEWGVVRSCIVKEDLDGPASRVLTRYRPCRHPDTRAGRPLVVPSGTDLAARLPRGAPPADVLAGSVGQVPQYVTYGSQPAGAGRV